MKPSRSQDTQSICRYCRRKISKSFYEIHLRRCEGRDNLYEHKEKEQRGFEKKSRPYDAEIKESKKTKTESFAEEKFPCYLCGHQQTMKELDEHFKICPNREIECEDCHQKFPRNLFQYHEIVCQGERESDVFSDDQNPFSDEQDENQSNQEGSVEDSSLGQLSDDSADESSEQSDSNRSLSASIEARRDIILNRITRMCTQRQNRRDFYDRLIIELHELHNQIRQRAREADSNHRGGMSKKRIDQIPNKKYKFDGINRETCSICFTDFVHNEEVKNFACKHLFHIECITQWLVRNKQCPNCKRVMTAGKNIKEESKQQKPSKKEAFLNGKK